MPDYGVTLQGFRRKRLADILAQKRGRAVELFADLVPHGEIVDTSDSSLLGRLILLDAPGDSELWEEMQNVYLSFDPNSATGVALDNLVALAGITRNRETYSTATAIVEGERGTVIPFGEQVSSPSTGNTFTTTSLVQLDLTNATGITVEVESVQNSSPYTISYTVGTSTSTIQYTSTSSATEQEILNGLHSLIVSQHPLLDSAVEESELIINGTDEFRSHTFTLSANLAAPLVRKNVDIVATQTGPLEQPPHSITKIDTPVFGWNSVTNPSAAVVGRNRETDEELRERFRFSKFQRASNISESLYSALISTSGVEEVVIYENETDSTDENGLPPHSFLPVILGGSGQEVAQAVWANKPLGILSYGNTTVQVLDSQGFPHDVSFERPNPVTIYISMDLSTNEDFPAFGEDRVREALIEYFREHFGIGDDVVYSRLYTAINSVPGHQVDSLFLGTSPNPTGTSNVEIGFNQMASLSEVNIEVNS